MILLVIHFANMLLLWLLRPSLPNDSISVEVISVAVIFI
jgi:hypothetical protein